MKLEYISSISFMGHSQCWQEYYLANDGLILCFTRHHFNIEYFNCYLAASSRSVDISIISMYSTTPQSGSTLESSSMLKDRDSQNIQPHCPASAEENNKKTCCYWKKSWHCKITNPDGHLSLEGFQSSLLLSTSEAYCSPGAVLYNVAEILWQIFFEDSTKYVAKPNIISSWRTRCRLSNQW